MLRYSAGLTDDPRDDKIRELEWHNHKLRDQIRALGVDLNNTRAQLQSTQASKTKLGVHCRDLEAQIVTLKARKTDAQYKLELDEADAQIAELRAEVVSLLNDLDEKQNSIADLESRVAVCSDPVHARVVLLQPHRPVAAVCWCVRCTRHRSTKPCKRKPMCAWQKPPRTSATLENESAWRGAPFSKSPNSFWCLSGTQTGFFAVLPLHATPDNLTEGVTVHRRCVLLEETLASTEAERAELKEQFAKFKQMHEQTFVDTREKMKELTAGLEEQRHAVRLRRVGARSSSVTLTSPRS